MQGAVMHQIQATLARFEYHCAIGTAFPLRGPTRRLKTAFRAATQCKEITHMKSCRSDWRLCWIKCLICCTTTDSDSVGRHDDQHSVRRVYGGLPCRSRMIAVLLLSQKVREMKKEREREREGERVWGGKKWERDERKARWLRKDGKTAALYGIFNKKPYRPAVKLDTEATRRPRRYTTMMHV